MSRGFLGRETSAWRWFETLRPPDRATAAVLREGIQVDGGSEFRAEFEDACQSATCASSCPRSGLNSTATSNAPKARGDTSSTASKTSHPASNRSSSASTPSPIASITQGLTKHLAISPQPSTSQSSARRSPRLIWAELGQWLASVHGPGSILRWRIINCGPLARRLLPPSRLSMFPLTSGQSRSISARSAAVASVSLSRDGRELYHRL